ncbi:MAG: lysine--tRNA ligase [Phycisphaerales bacterium]
MSDTATDPTPTSPHADNEFVRQRLANRQAVADLGLKPYGVREDDLVLLASAHDVYSAEADAAYQQAEADRKAKLKEDPQADVPASPDDRTRVRVAGRVVLHRDNGKLVWLNLRDSTGDLQIAVSKRDCTEAGFNLAKHTDLADIIVAEGPLMKTRAGELTVWAADLRAGSKAIEPPPEKHAGLSDPEARFRRRYVDLWSNPEAMARLVLRGKVVRETRAYMEELGFAEVETPVLQAQAGGAAARPFMTHLNALDMSLSLRIAPELYLKRLLVAGMPRVFEMSRNFRNEGLSRRHNPEFTSMEAYQAFGDAHTMLELAEGLVRRLAEMVCADPAYTGLYPDATTSAMPWEGLEINYADPFVQVEYGDLFEKAVGCSMFDAAAVRTAATDAGYGDANTTDHWLLVDRLFEHKAEDLIDKTRPTFVLHYPSATSPLTRPLEDRPELAGRWDLFIAGMEIGPAYTELNDPEVQEAKFRQQLKGAQADDDTFRTLDEDFLRALRVGMPPAGGIGLGIDRIAMLLTGGASLREVIPFPFMRPEA